MPIEKGDLVYIDYIGSVRESGDIFDTTLEEEARNAEIFRSNGVYEPFLVAVDSGWVIKGLEDALVGKEVGQDFKLEAEGRE